MLDALDASAAGLRKKKTKNAVGVKIEKLPGDASTRQYYRVRFGEASFVLMRVEPFHNEGDDYPFLAVRRHLEESGVPVPRVHEVDPRRGLVLLEDLGDVTLLRKLQDVSDSEVERHLYERVLDDLVKLQIQADPARARRPIPGFALSFDHEKLMWEARFTIEHFYEKHLGREIAPADRKTLESSFSSICGVLASQPRVFTHRDFHSRNIMAAPDGRLVMIDFQDARMGPAQYDLVSLLKDSYYQLEEAQIQRLIDYYIARWEAGSGRRLDRDEFRRIFDLMAVQRGFKAIGSFASFQNRRGITTYLKYIGNTFENIRRVLVRYPEYSRLREVLFHYYYF